MKSHSRAVIIGGGIAGCSVAYHLTRLGWADVTLIEKGELTSGTTWHSVGNTPMFSTSLNLLKLLKRSVELYESLEAETGQPTGFRRVGSLRLATTPDLVDWYKGIAGMARLIDVPFEMVSVEAARALCPILNTEGVLCASYMPSDGYADASSITHALAIGARNRGAEIYRNNRVLEIERLPGGEWQVVTEAGTIRAEVVVNATGQWAREIGQMAGVALPILPMEHHYLVTDAIPAIESLPKEIPVTRDPERSFYLRQEADGLLIGFYERNPRPWAVDGIPRDFGQQLLPPDLAQVEDCFATAVERVPILGTAPIRRMVNGPDAYTPDGRCIMGEAPGLKNFFVLAGFSCFGVANSGGAGSYLAEWIMDGRPSDDMWELDVRRYGAHNATKKFLIEKVCETYEKEFAIHYPHEERPAGRPIKTSPLYDRLREQGAVFGARGGWERPTWFAPAGVEPEDEHTFRRPNWFEHVGRECLAVRQGVGVLDQTSFAKFEVWGPGAAAFLERLCANRVDIPMGKIVITQALNAQGGMECDLTLTRLAPDRYFVITAAALATHDFDWIEKHLPSDGSVAARDVTGQYGCLTLSGPRSRDVLAQIADSDMSNAGQPFLTSKNIHIGYAPVRAMRLSYVGELGWELYHPIEYQRYIYDAIIEAGQRYGIINYGYRALDSMRMEKGFRLWGLDLSALNTPFEAGLGRFVKMDKGDFTGREALLRQQQAGLRRKLTTLVVEGSPVVPHGWEPVLDGEAALGYVTSGEHGHVVDKTIALAYLPPEYAEPGVRLQIEILGERFPAVTVKSPVYDPTGSRMRG